MSMDYEVTIESRVPGAVLEDAERFLEELATAGDGLDREPTLGVDEPRRQVLATIAVDAADGRDAHDAALEVFDAAWAEAFGDATTPILAIRCRPASEAALAAAAEADEEEELEPADAG
jgi:hypothetical protein